MNLSVVPLLFMGLFSGEADEPIELSLASGSYQVEIADTAFEQMRGLMGRDGLAFDQGMLFVYDRDQRVQFWMKNVVVPLDMIFLDSCGSVVEIHSNAVPGDTSIIEPETAVRAVLELRGGASKRDQIRVGDHVVGGEGFFRSC